MNSDNYEVKVINKEKGKGLFAVCPLKEGDIIFMEKPIVCCQFPWNAEYGYSACDHCLKPLETAEENVHRLTENSTIILPYANCCETKKELITECSECGVKYCSIECQNEAYARYHRILCFHSRVKDDTHPLRELIELWKYMHYPPESGTIMLPARMVAMVNQADNEEELLSTFSQFCHRTVNEAHGITHGLLGPDFDGRIILLRETMMKALDTKLTSNWFTPDGFRSLLTLVNTNAQGIGTSAFSVWVKNVSALHLSRHERINVDKLIDNIYSELDKVSGILLNNEGSGLYVLQSAVNHSCVPNAVVEFPYSNNVLVLKAIRDIQPEEEICISYLDECDLERSRHSRQEILRSLYLFVCRCDKCLLQADDPDVTSEDELDDELDELDDELDELDDD